MPCLFAIPAVEASEPGKTAVNRTSAHPARERFVNPEIGLEAGEAGLHVAWASDTKLTREWGDDAIVGVEMGPFTVVVQVVRVEQRRPLRSKPLPSAHATRTDVIEASADSKLDLEAWTGRRW